VILDYLEQILMDIKIIVKNKLITKMMKRKEKEGFHNM
jgi:hypothetical protein